MLPYLSRKFPTHPKCSASPVSSVRKSRASGLVSPVGSPSFFQLLSRSHTVLERKEFIIPGPCASFRYRKEPLSPPPFLPPNSHETLVPPIYEGFFTTYFPVLTPPSPGDPLNPSVPQEDAKSRTKESALEEELVLVRFLRTPPSGPPPPFVYSKELSVRMQLRPKD